MLKHTFLPVFLFINFIALNAQIAAPGGLLRENFTLEHPRALYTPRPKAESGLRSGLTDALDAAFDSVTTLSTLKGFTAAVVLPDGSVWKRAHGANAGYPLVTALNTNHLMGMGSITKTFVSTTMLLLVEDGLLSLDDSIGQYVGPYPNIDGSATLRQLLSHRTGFNDYLNENPVMIDTWVAHLDSIWEADTVLNHYILAPNFAVGADWSYSNTNYLLAGRIIESVTGQPWYQVLRDRVLTPQGLTHTFAYPWESTGTQQIAHVWLDIDGNGTVEDAVGLGLPIEGFFSLGNSAGCLMSTPEDIGRFMERLFSGNILQASSLAEMQTDYVQDPSVGLQYGLGAASFAGFPTENWGHDGSIIYKSWGLYFPELDIAIVVQQNDDRIAALDPQLIDLVDVFVSLLLTYIDNAPSVGTGAPVLAATPLATPNPATDRLQLQLPADLPLPALCTLSDAQGKPVWSQWVAMPTQEVNLGQLPAGLYYLKAGNLMEKVVVNR